MPCAAHCGTGRPLANFAAQQRDQINLKSIGCNFSQYPIHKMMRCYIYNLHNHLQILIAAKQFLSLETNIIQMPLNNTQLEILKLFEHEQSEEDLKEIKSLLVTYLADKVTREADKTFDEKDYSSSILEKWKKNHLRKSA